MYRNEALLAEIRKLPCGICGRPAPSRACHGNYGKGIGIKASDASAFPGCDHCHHVIDQSGRLVREERRALEERANLNALRTLIERGRLVPKGGE